MKGNREYEWGKVRRLNVSGNFWSEAESYQRIENVLPVRLLEPRTGLVLVRGWSRLFTALIYAVTTVLCDPFARRDPDDELLLP